MVFFVPIDTEDRNIPFLAINENHNLIQGLIVGQKIKLHCESETSLTLFCNYVPSNCMFQIDPYSLYANTDKYLFSCFSISSYFNVTELLNHNKTREVKFNKVIL